MQNKVLKKGYLVEIHTYEGDGDYNMTGTLSGLSYNALKMVQDICQLFTGEYGNQYERGSLNIVKIVAELVSKHVDEDNTLQLHVDDIAELLSDMTLAGVTEYYTRSFSDMGVYWVSEDIEIPFCYSI